MNTAERLADIRMAMKSLREEEQRKYLAEDGGDKLLKLFYQGDMELMAQDDRISRMAILGLVAEGDVGLMERAMKAIFKPGDIEAFQRYRREGMPERMHYSTDRQRIRVHLELLAEEEEALLKRPEGESS